MPSVWTRRHDPFEPSAYPEPTRSLIEAKLRPVAQIVAELPRRFSLFSTFAASAARGFLHALGERDDWEHIDWYCALTVEPYRALSHPAVRIFSAYASPLDRLLAERMGKTVAHVPRQFIQFCDYLADPGRIEVITHTCTPPDADGYVNLGLNVETVWETLTTLSQRAGTRVIFEINPHTPWIEGDAAYNHNRMHLSMAHAVYVNERPLPQLPALQPSEVERRIAEHVVRYVDDGDTVQLGIGGVPNYVAEHLKSRRCLKIHSEMITEAMVDLVNAGAVDCHGKPYHDGYIVGAFAAGSDKLYDWLDHNPLVRLLPIRAVNDPALIGTLPRMKSINSALAIDLHGQACSDAVGFKQVSGIGGQLEFVMGALRSPGGRSVLCIKSTRKVGRRLRSNIGLTLPRGTPVAVPRHFADVVVTEWGAAELRHLSAPERARALIGIAHPDFRDELVRQAKQARLWDFRPGFAKPTQRLMWEHLPTIIELQKAYRKGELWAESKRRFAGWWKELGR